MIKKKLLREALKSNYNAIPLTTSNNNGLADKNTFSKASYSNTNCALVAKLGAGGIVGIISIFKDHELMNAEIYIQCYNGKNRAMYAKMQIKKTREVIKLFYRVVDDYMYIYIQCAPYCCYCFTPLSIRSSINADMNFTAAEVQSIPDDVTEVLINE